MLTLVDAGTANQVWLDNLRRLFEEGYLQTARGLEFYEIPGFSSTFDMNYPVISIPERNFGKHFCPAEAYWILSGQNRVDTIGPWSNMISKFSNDGIHFDGAYGPQVMDQIRYVVDCLAEDQGSRQAVLTIWRPNPRPSKDIPCTVAMQFLIRKNRLHCITTMRSSDLWLGWVYDCFNFTMITAYIGLCLNQRGIEVSLGNLQINAGSQHIYVSDVQKHDLTSWVFRPHTPEQYNFGNVYGRLNHPNELMDFLHGAREIGIYEMIDGWGEKS